MVPKLRHLIVGSLFSLWFIAAARSVAAASSVAAAGAAASSDGGGGIKWFPWVPLFLAGIGLGIAGVAMRKDDKKDRHPEDRGPRDDDTGESPVVHRPPPAATASTGTERIPPRPPPKPS
jgi:hypothetical protein